MEKYDYKKCVWLYFLVCFNNWESKNESFFNYYFSNYSILSNFLYLCTCI